MAIRSVFAARLWGLEEIHYFFGIALIDEKTPGFSPGLRIKFRR